MQILQIWNEFKRALARKICERQWHAINFHPERLPGDNRYLGGMRMYCSRCGETLGHL